MDVKEISSSAYNAMVIELETIEKDLELVAESMQSAREKGDASENTELDESKKEYDRLQARKAVIAEKLSTSKIVQASSNRIMPGTLIDVKFYGIDNNSYYEDLGLLMYDNEGNGVLHGKVTPDSSLGAQIKDGDSGDYTVIGVDGKRYRASVTIQSQDRLPEFLSLYPVDVASKLATLFK